MRMGLGPMPKELRGRLADLGRALALQPVWYEAGSADLPDVVVVHVASRAACTEVLEAVPRESVRPRHPLLVPVFDEATPEDIDGALCAGADDYLGSDWSDDHISLRLRIIRSRLIEAARLREEVTRLEQSESHHRNLIEFSPGGVAIYVDDRIAAANRSLADLLGARTPRDLVGKQFCQFMSPEDQELAELRLEALTSGETSTIPFSSYEIHNFEGRRMIIEIGGVPISYEGEQAVALLVHDVTEAEEQREQIESERAKLRTLIDALPFSLTVLDSDFLVHTQNRVSRQRWGDLRGRGALAIDIPDDLRREALDQLERAASGHHIDEYLSAYVQGERFITRMILAPVEDDRGVQWIVGASIDSTEQHILEDAIRHVAEQATDPSGESIFQAMAHHLAEALGVTYASILRVEGNCLRTLGYVGGGDPLPAIKYKIEGTPCEIVLRDGAALYEDDLGPCFPDDPMLYELEIVSYGGVVLADADGNPIGLVNVFDTKPLRRPKLVKSLLEIFARRAASELLNARADAQRELLSAKLQQAQKLESLGLLAGGIAHDFNNLLTAIIGPASMARARVEPGSLLAELLDSIESSAASAAELTQQILAYSGRGRFVVERVNAARVVGEVVSLLSAGLPKLIELEYRSEVERLPIEVDVAQFRQVVLNLGTNAADAIGESEGTVSVRTRELHASELDLMEGIVQPPPAPGHFACIEVSDNGCGIKADHIQRIFEPFFSTKQQSRGLGLAAVIGIVRAHQGTLLVASEEGRGTTMRLLLPLASSAEDTDLGRLPSTERWHGSGCVLLVEDETPVMITARTILESAGLEVIPAIDGVEAIDLFERHRSRIDCVLLDLTMPRMGGQEAMSHILRIDPMARIVLCSGYTAQDTVERCGIRGHLGFLQKPYRERDLLAAIRMAMTPATSDDKASVLGEQLG